jgi:hypothetical protein
LYLYYSSTAFILRSSLCSNNASQLLFLIYVISEPLSALIGVFLILLYLAKLLNQYYYSLSGTSSSLSSTIILLTQYDYLLLLLVLPFLLLLLIASSPTHFLLNLWYSSIISCSTSTLRSLYSGTSHPMATP